MTDRQPVSALLLLQPRPLVLPLLPSQETSQWVLTDYQGQPLELRVCGADGRDVWIFSVSLCDESGQNLSSLNVIKVTTARSHIWPKILAQEMGLKLTS